MIKKINILSFILLLVTSLLSLFTYQDDMDLQIPNISLVFIIFTFLFGTLLALKIVIRWHAISISMKHDGYKINRNGFQNAIIYDGVFLIFFLLVGLSLLIYVTEIWFVGLVLILFVVEGVVLVIINLVYKPYKIIVNKDSIITINNSIEILHWNTIKKVEESRNDIHLINKLGQTSVFNLELLSVDDAMKFRQELKSIAQEKGLYYGVHSS